MRASSWPAGTRVNDAVSHTRRAERDLIAHFAFIARDKIAPADEFLNVTAESFARLAVMPGMGRAWESANRRLAGVRVYPMPAPYRSYLIFYRVADDVLEVLAVLHGSRDIGAALEELFDV